MRKIHQGIIGLFLISTSLNGLAAEIRVAFGKDSAPFVFKEGGGLEIDIIEAALKKQGHSLKPVYLKTENFKNALRLNRVDAISNMKLDHTDKQNPSLFFSDDYMFFKNYIITKTNSPCTVKSIESLTECHVGAWVGAPQHLKGKWRSYFNNTAFKLNKNYFEFTDQNAQVKMFLQDRLDALMIDENIFKYQYNNLKSQFNEPMTFTHHDLFDEPNRTNLVFTNEQLRNDFNKGLKALKRSGEYEQFFIKYLGKASPFSKPKTARKHSIQK